MKIRIYVERNVSEMAEIELLDRDHLKTLIKDRELFDEIENQGSEFEETVGEVLYTTIEIIDENDQVVEKLDYEDLCDQIRLESDEISECD